MTGSRRALVLGTFDPDFGRNRQIVRLMEAAGWEVEVRPIPLWSGQRTDDVTGGRLTLLARGGVAMARVVWSFLTARRPDVLVVLHPGQFDALALGLPARLRRVPLVLDFFVSLHETVVDRQLAPPESRQGRLWRWVDRRALRQASLVLVDTPEAAEIFAAEAGLSKSRFAAVWVGADPGFYVPQPGVDVVAGRVLFMGTYIPLHGIDHIISAAAMLQDEVAFRLLGDGQERARIEALAAEIDAPVEFVGSMPERELAAEIAAAEICLGVFGAGPKTARVVPNKVFQYMAVGRPCITADTPSVRTALDGLVATVPPADPEALASAIRTLHRDSVERERLTSAAHDAFRTRFSDPQVGRVLAEALEGLRPESRRVPPLTVMARLRRGSIMRQFRRVRPADVLEVGTGQGAMGWRLSRLAQYVGVEPDAESAAVAISRIRSPWGQVRCGGVDVVDPGQRFDLVCSFEVLEHIEDDVEALRSWRDRLRPGGAVVLSVPAHRSRFGASDVAVGHFRRYDRADVEQLVGAAGFEVERIDAYGAGLGHAVEVVRNRVLHRRAEEAAGEPSAATGSSGRLFQPTGRITGLVTWLVAAPGRLVQLPFRSTSFGTGWVVLARRVD